MQGLGSVSNGAVFLRDAIPGGMEFLVLAFWVTWRREGKTSMQ